jgi:hypothetical protein
MAWSFLVLLVIASLPLLPILATSILLIIATLSHLRQSLKAAHSLIDGVIVAVATIFLTASILPATELVNRILGSIDLEYSLYDLDGCLSLEDASIGMVNCKVFHLPGQQNDSFKQLGGVFFVLWVEEAHLEAQARSKREFQRATGPLDGLAVEELLVSCIW